MLELESSKDSRVSCIIRVSFANYAHFQVVVSQQGRKVVQRDAPSHHCGDAALCVCHSTARWHEQPIAMSLWTQEDKI